MSAETKVDPPPKILIAEDDPQSAELLEVYLADMEYEVRIARDGEEALTFAMEWIPDLLLLDVMMPKISGFEVCERLKEEPQTRGVAILMVTALDQASDIDRAVAAGTDDFLSKPINKTELLLRVRSMLKSRLVQRELDRALAYIKEVEQGTS